MKKKVLIIFSTLIIAGLIAILILFRNGSGQDGKYEFVELTQGNIENTISSTGTLSPVTTVEVGTQVSGTIAAVYVDFNDRVREGQLLAILDTVLLKISVNDAQAGLERAEAQLEQAQSDRDRNLALFKDALISEGEFIPFRVNLKNQQAAYKSAQASLERAQRNLKYAVIRSPINGMVINRNVEAGQTVAASFSTPTLFQIAEDLTNMEILVNVDESDIGMVKEGQRARFQVQAYMDKIFEGSVKQVRLQPVTISNVVNYTVVVSAKNDENLLLPGMTATVDFIIENKKDVLLVPKSALRFQPPEKIVTAFREQRRKEMESMPDSVREKRHQQQQGMGSGGGSNGAASFRQHSNNMTALWYLDEKGNLAMDPVGIGISDGTNTEITRSRHLKAGIKVISAILDSETQPGQSRTNQVISGRPPSPGGPFRGF